MNTLPNRCPICGGEIHVTRFHCDQCDVTIEGRFTVGKFANLNNEQLQLQGTSEKFAWSAIINRSSGKLTVTIADRMGAYVMFGQCKAAGAPSQ